jgi:hypothetical protein
MQLVLRNKIRQMLLDGSTELQIAEQEKLSKRQIEKYVRDIRLEDYEELASEGAETRASAMQSAKAEFTRLKRIMVDIMNNAEHSAEKMAAFDRIRQIEHDLVNLKLNGPMVLRSQHALATNRVLRGDREESPEFGAITLPSEETTDGGSPATESGPDTP